MFYVYCRSYYPVYEPAEGGYYVCASEVSECAEFNTLEDAYAEFIDSVAEAEKTGMLCPMLRGIVVSKL